MNPNPPQIQLSWDDPVTGDRREPIARVPIALGREFQKMPTEIEGRRVTRLVLNSLEVSRFHGLIDWKNGSFFVVDQGSQNGLKVNSQNRQEMALAHGDILTIGPYAIAISLFVGTAPTQPPNPSQIPFNPTTNSPDPQPQPSRSSNFPPPAFEQPEVNPQDLHATGLQVKESEYATIGGGLGSFIWADCLRIFGVPADEITALGVDSSPYSRYKQLCLNSQIPLHERLRSNSDSCPDNLWGFPSYAWREAWQDLRRGQLKNALSYLWQVFAEPTFTQTYTPRASNVFDSIDREQKRIGWDKIFCYGSVRAIRKTTDGRYAIAYSQTTTQGRDRAFLIARFVSLATGYPAIKFLPDLQAYREKTKDFQSVVNAYEPHDFIYEQLEQKGGTILLRGRGIVASRIIQRLDEARSHNPKIRIIHLMRSPKSEGQKFRRARRTVKNHFEFQPFNWPKACWSGDLRVELERANPQQRQQLITDWGGTTTADRQDWYEEIERGLKEGWYRIEFGRVERVERETDGIITYIQNSNYKGELRLEADFIIDATGLDADVSASPLLNDLVTHYNLPLNPLGRLRVSNEFESVEMRTSRGRIYAIGAITLGGPYAAVDSFLGLQYAALRSVYHLAKTRAPRVKKLNFATSLGQWFKWVADRAPS
ncbi:FHA domain-containing protein [Lusitaniella coriacea LEGE 07157]|uniref:FHA domain-containing protein n=1 Tax=Lusitaniella coriacea LEGE 07157 TaxID=945747 RepID=A0A8J7E0J2_9CYAN|nr:FHA domain-containing protein [Lusitaniella coriacea]MBE9117059.1 FHA domain-containing protein [Lusitaniella coriacea LEGE 07157]